MYIYIQCSTFIYNVEHFLSMNDSERSEVMFGSYIEIFRGGG